MLSQSAGGLSRDSSLWPAGNQGRTTGGSHAVQGNGDSVYGVGAAALDDGKNTFAQRATDVVPYSDDGFAVEVGLSKGLKYDAAVSGEVAEADDVFHKGKARLWV